MLARSARIRKRVTFVHYGSLPEWSGNDGGSLSEASSSGMLQTHVCVIYCFGQLVARERLARLKSTFNLKLVRRYRDKKGQSKIKGGPHLTQSGAYPINLGLKAGIGSFSQSHLFRNFCVWQFLKDVLCLVGGILTECLRVTWRTWANWMNICRPQ